MTTRVGFSLKAAFDGGPAKNLNLSHLFLLLIFLVGSTGCGGDRKPDNPVHPTGGSVVCMLFVDHGAASKRACESITRLQGKYGHQLHVLCFDVDRGAEAKWIHREMERCGVKTVPSAVFDEYWIEASPTEESLNLAIETCLKKPDPKLSMELQAGPIADHLAATFQMCSHSSRLDFDGSVEVYAFERQVSMGSFVCEAAALALVAVDEKFHVSTDKCHPPMVLAWPVPSGKNPHRLGILVLVRDRAHKLVDSICSDRTCSRTGKCG